MAYYLLNADSNDAPIGVLLFSTIAKASQAGDKIGYIPVYRSVDPYLIVNQDSDLGRELDKYFGEDGPKLDKYEQDFEEMHRSSCVIEFEAADTHPGLINALRAACVEPNSLGNQPEMVASFGEFYGDEWDDEE